MAALIYALHVVALGRLARPGDAVGLAAAQMITAAIGCAAAALAVQGRIGLPTTTFDWAALVYMALVSGALAMIMQSGRKHTSRPRVAVIMATEPLWAGRTGGTLARRGADLAAPGRRNADPGGAGPGRDRAGPPELIAASKGRRTSPLGVGWYAGTLHALALKCS